MEKRGFEEVFELREQISTNDHVETWLAWNKDKGSPCVLKLSVDSTLTAPGKAKSYLDQSFKYQSTINSSRLLRAVDQHVFASRLAIEYPLLETSKWRRLEGDRFLASWRTILVSMSETIDFLHLAGFVHCDLKLENFFIESKDMGNGTILADLDFLRPTGEAADGYVFGTPEFFPPELIANDPLTASSDNYSFGQSIGQTIRAIENTEKEARKTVTSDSQSLKVFLRCLTSDNPCERSQTLGDALLYANVVSKKGFDYYMRRLLSRCLINRYSQSKRKYANCDDRTKYLLGKGANIYGVPVDLIDDLAETSKQSPRLILTLIKMIVDKSKLVLEGDLWHVQMLPEIICEIYSQSAHPSAVNLSADRKGESHVELYVLLKVANRLIRKRRYARALYLLESRFNSFSLPSESPIHPMASIFYIQLADCHIANGDILRGVELYKLAIDNSAGRPYKAARICHKLVQICLDYGYFDEVDNIISRGLTLSTACQSEVMRLKFQLKRVWREGEVGNLSLAESILKELSLAAGINHQSDLRARILYASGVLEWRKGRYERAREKITASLNEQPETLSDKNRPYAHMALAHLHFETGEYRKAVRHCTSAIDLDEHGAEFRRVGMMILTLVNCYIRMGEFIKAKKRLKQFLPAMNSQNFSRALILHNLSLGWLLLEEGKYQLSHDHLQRALSLAQSARSGLLLGRIYQNLANLYLIRGRTSLCKQSCKSATEIFKTQKNQAAIAEISLIGYLNRLYSEPSSKPDELETILDSLLESDSTYYAALCGFHMLMSSEVHIREQAISKLSKIGYFIHQSPCPLSKSLRIVLAIQPQLTEGQPEAGLLKKAYSELNKSGNKFFASLVCCRLSQFYQAQRNDHLAHAYLDFAMKLLGGMGNKPLQKVFKSRSRVSPLLPAKYDRSDWLMSKLLKVSEVITDPDAFQDTLETILTNLLEMTGAERGAIVIEEEPPNGPRVIAYVNCDADIADDIRDISLMTPMTALERDEPFVVADATTNETTKHYKSVLKHNILSLICIPLRAGPGLKGILYLDHHTLPAFFQSFDVDLAKMISNLVSITITSGASYRTLYHKHTQAEKDLAKLGAGSTLVTIDPHMLSLLKTIETVARSNATVLITGESGCGKEIIADLLHAHSHRKEKPIIKINCAAIPDNLIESELFGVAKNAVTGVDKREGLLSAADGGTLFIDEIGDLSFSIQAKLLRVLEDGRFRKIGSTYLESSDIRYIYATNKNLRQLVRRGEFREDLFYRLNTIEVKIPALRDRRNDVDLLITHFLKIFSPSSEDRPIVNGEVLTILRSYNWPGNVRELKNLVERFCVLFSGRSVNKADLPQEILESQEVLRVRSRRNLPNRRELKSLLVSHGGNQSAVARVTRIPVSTLNRHIKNLGLNDKV